MDVDGSCTVDFGRYDGRYYYGTGNNIYANTKYDAIAVNNSYIDGEYNWWGTVSS